MPKPEGEPKSFAQFCKRFEDPEFHKNKHPEKRDIVLFVINVDLLLVRFPDGPFTGRFVAAHLNFCQDCNSLANEVKKRRKEFEV